MHPGAAPLSIQEALFHPNLQSIFLGKKREPAKKFGGRRERERENAIMQTNGFRGIGHFQICQTQTFMDDHLATWEVSGFLSLSQKVPENSGFRKGM